MTFSWFKIKTKVSKSHRLNDYYKLSNAPVGTVINYVAHLRLPIMTHTR